MLFHWWFSCCLFCVLISNINTYVPICSWATDYLNYSCHAICWKQFWFITIWQSKNKYKKYIFIFLWSMIANLVFEVVLIVFSDGTLDVTSFYLSSSKFLYIYCLIVPCRIWIFLIANITLLIKAGVSTLLMVALLESLRCVILSKADFLLLDFWNEIYICNFKSSSMRQLLTRKSKP